ncbi:MAG TPA: hypothetical protein VHD90_25925 [Phototrophicaceae bacterium]|nr:hypothetical protein [Phototrophicaceae bacterium]
MKLVMLITAKVESGLDIAQAWQEAGAPGVTIVRSHGLHQLQRGLRSGSLELPPVLGSMGAAMAALLDSVEESTEIILSVVDDVMVDALITATTPVLGDLTQPNHGILVVLPIDQAIGVRRHDGA